jgi:uncharacterized protein (TIGR03084 family)
METWAHALDVHEALGVEPEITDRIRHVAHLGVRTRDFAFAVHGLDAPLEEFKIRLTAPSGQTWSWGPGGGRRSRCADRRATSACSSPSASTAPTPTWVATGPDANRWLDIAQCFAGPPGAGRPAR